MLLVACAAAEAGVPSQLSTSSGSERAASARAARARPVDGLTLGDRSRFLDQINESCADTYCEGAFKYRFHDLQCDFSQSTCTIAFSMATDAPTRPVVARQPIEVAGAARVSANISRVVPPAQCDRYEADLAAAGPPCTMIEAQCSLVPLRSAAEFEQSYRDPLSACVWALEKTILENGTSDSAR